MKVYEKLEIDLNTEKGIKKLIHLTCNDIPDVYGREDTCTINGKNCPDCKIDRLFSEYVEPNLKSRISTTKDVDVLRNCLADFHNECSYPNCLGCRKNPGNLSFMDSSYCFEDFMEELVECED